MTPDEKRARKAATQRAWRANLPPEQLEALREKHREKMRARRAGTKRKLAPQKKKASPGALSPTQRAALLDVAPTEPGDHVVSLADGPCAIVRRDQHGARIVAFGRDAQEALARLQRPIVRMVDRLPSRKGRGASPFAVAKAA